MKEVKVKLYKFEELSDEVKKSIVDKERWDVCHATMEGYASDYQSTLEKFAELMGIKVTSWSVDYCDYNFSFKFKSDYAFGDCWSCFWIYNEQCTGKLLRRWLNNNFLPRALKPKLFVKYSAGYDKEKHRWNKHRYSKIQRERWDNCPLTGMIYDCSVMEVVMEVLAKPIPETYSLEDLIEDCLDKFFKDWQGEYEYWASDEGVKEQITNWYEDQLFYEDGTKFCGIYEDVA